MEKIKCPKCGQTLSVFHWNKDKNIMICRNDNCLAFRNPVYGMDAGNSFGIHDISGSRKIKT
jgi:hypothetical protein